MSAILRDYDREAIEAVLPQTQCGQCGFEGCTPYAEALLAGEAATDRCPPGGDVVAAALARLLQRAPLPYDRTRGTYLPPQLAAVREAECIGCTKCIQACPIDAIIGAAERMHTVLRDACSGCGLCIPPCPVDCIDLVLARPALLGAEPTFENPLSDPVAAAHTTRHPEADRWRRRHDARTVRLAARVQARAARLRQRSSPVGNAASHLPPVVAAAMARAQQRLAALGINRDPDQSADGGEPPP